MRLVQPTLDHVPSYAQALERGWSPNNLRAEAGLEELRAIREDAASFVASLTDPEARGAPIRMPDGSLQPRLPGYVLWMWDEEGFAGSINFRWRPGTERLPEHVLGHLGYAVVPWKRERGYATRALGLMRERVRAQGLRYADLTCDADNLASRKVIVANGGFPLHRFRKPEAWGGKDSWLFRWYTGAPFTIEIETPRLRLRQWRDEDKAPFAALNADPRVMEHFLAPLTREESNYLVDRCRTAIERRGWGSWAVERREDGAFLGFTGLTVVRDELPMAPAVEVGWRMAVHAWGAGYATEAAQASLRFAFGTLEIPEVIAYTAWTNVRSMAVMRRLGMSERESFDHPSIPMGHRLRPHVVFSKENPRASAECTLSSLS